MTKLKIWTTGWRSWSADYRRLYGQWWFVSCPFASLAAHTANAVIGLVPGYQGRCGRASGDPGFYLQLHPEALVHRLLDASGQIKNGLAGGTTVIDQHQGVFVVDPGA